MCLRAWSQLLKSRVCRRASWLFGEILLVCVWMLLEIKPWFIRASCCGKWGSEVPGLRCTNRKLPEAPFACNLAWSRLPVPSLPGSCPKWSLWASDPQSRALLWQRQSLLLEGAPGKPSRCSGLLQGLLHRVGGECAHLPSASQMR